MGREIWALKKESYTAINGLVDLREDIEISYLNRFRVHFAKSVLAEDKLPGSCASSTRKYLWR